MIFLTNSFLKNGNSFLVLQSIKYTVNNKKASQKYQFQYVFHFLNFEIVFFTTRIYFQLVFAQIQFVITTKLRLCGALKCCYSIQ